MIARKQQGAAITYQDQRALKNSWAAEWILSQPDTKFKALVLITKFKM